MPEVISLKTRSLDRIGRSHDRLRNCARRCLDFLSNAAERIRQRRALASLDDRMLKDIGLTRSEAWREYTTPFWR